MFFCINIYHFLFIFGVFISFNITMAMDFWFSIFVFIKIYFTKFSINYCKIPFEAVFIFQYFSFHNLLLYQTLERTTLVL
jgi:hypothetical protein